MKKPNILILIPHDLGVFLRCYGNPSVESPNLDKLSATGVRFTHNFTTCPECTASRGGMMTGYPPHQNGLMGLVPFGWSLKVPHLAGRMKKLGYATYQFGFQHETHQHASSLGYDHVRTFEDHIVQTVCGGLRDFLKTGEASKTSRGSLTRASAMFTGHGAKPQNLNLRIFTSGLSSGSAGGEEGSRAVSSGHLRHGFGYWHGYGNTGTDRA